MSSLQDQFRKRTQTGTQDTNTVNKTASVIGTMPAQTAPTQGALTTQQTTTQQPTSPANISSSNTDALRSSLSSGQGGINTTEAPRAADMPTSPVPTTQRTAPEGTVSATRSQSLGQDTQAKQVDLTQPAPTIGTNITRAAQQEGQPPSASAPPGEGYDPLGYEGDPQMDEIRNLWADILAGSEAGLESQLQGITADESRNARRASEMGSGMVGGNFQGGQIQAQMGGTLMRSQARGEQQLRQLELKNNFLNQMKDLYSDELTREQQLQLQQMINDTQTNIAAASNENQMAMLNAGLGIGADEGADGGQGGGRISDDTANKESTWSGAGGGQASDDDSRWTYIGDGGGMIESPKMPKEYNSMSVDDWEDFLSDPLFASKINPARDFPEVQNQIDKYEQMYGGSFSEPEREAVTQYYYWYAAANGAWPNDGEVQNFINKIRSEDIGKEPPPEEQENG